MEIRAMKKLIELKHHKFGKTYITKVAVIYPLKNNGKRYATPMVIPAGGYEKTQEDVLARLQRNNPNRKYEIA